VRPLGPLLSISYQFGMVGGWAAKMTTRLEYLTCLFSFFFYVCGFLIPQLQRASKRPLSHGPTWLLDCSYSP
jgi:hypothetical protein